jgi:Right handed beta helix region
MKIASSSCALAFLLLAPRVAVAQSPDCTFEFTSLPYTINSSGTYCLKNTMLTSLSSGAAITIGAGYQVTVDLRGFALINVPSTTSTAVGVQGLGKSNVTVRNGRIQGFRQGVVLDDSPTVPEGERNVVEDVQVDQARTTGILVDGRGSRVRRCVVTYYGVAEPIGAPVGIQVSGSGNVIEDNVVGESLSSNGRGIAVYGTNHLVVGNRVTNPQNYGLFLVNSPTTKYRDNLVVGAVTAYDGGTDAGNNQ